MFRWTYWRDRSLKGDEFAARIALDQLVSGLRNNTLDDEQRAFLADGLQQLARAVTPEEKNAAIRVLHPGRRPGRSTQVKAEELSYARARAVREALTEVRRSRKDLKKESRILDAACEAAIKELQGIDAAAKVDLRAYKKAYKAWVPTFDEIDAADSGN